VRWTVAALCALLLAGCGHSSSGLAASDAKHVVLNAADLPSGFESFASAATSSLDVQGTSRSNLQRFGREGGWVERLRRPAPRRRGLLIVVSTVDVFKDARGANADLMASGDDLASQRKNGLARRLAAPRLGDAAVAARLLAPGGEHAYTISWADRNASASVTGLGFGVSLGDVVALARKQEAKLAAR
jgi:hypothetical protein